ncbi:MAG: L,D-transpeptidase family protein [Terracidiphilus sp.]|jgi:D-alanyl-D-alanine dipeptidase
MKIRWISGCVVALCAASLALAEGREPDALRASTQILIVTTQDWNGADGRLQVYERPRVGKRWKAAGDAIPVVVGKNGLGWGAGVATDAARREAADPIKKEGDGKSPAGVFRLSTVFGYAAQEPAAWKMPYLNLSPSVECVDDASSKFYNRVLERATVAPDWSSSEQMLRPDGEYRWGVVVEHNAEPVTPGVGSCIFLHIWLGPGVGTTGCTAMAQEQLEALLARLDPARTPLLVQLPRPQYKKLRRQWKLPGLPRQK